MHVLQYSGVQKNSIRIKSNPNFNDILEGRQKGDYPLLYKMTENIIFQL